MLTILEFKEEVGHLNSKLEGMIESICMLNYGTENLKEVLGVGNSLKDIKGIGYNGESSNSKNMFLTPIQKT